MKIHWTRSAVDHLVNIYECISLNSPTCGKRVVDKITRRSEQNANHPRICSANNEMALQGSR